MNPGPTSFLSSPQTHSGFLGPVAVVSDRLHAATEALTFALNLKNIDPVALRRIIGEVHRISETLIGLVKTEDDRNVTTAPPR